MALSAMHRFGSDTCGEDADEVREFELGVHIAALVMILLTSTFGITLFPADLQRGFISDYRKSSEALTNSFVGILLC
jgi:hypothetical protein